MNIEQLCQDTGIPDELTAFYRMAWEGMPTDEFFYRRPKKKPWHYPEWKERREELVGDTCGACGSTDGPMVLQHTKQPRPLKAVRRDVMPPSHLIPEGMYADVRRAREATALRLCILESVEYWSFHHVTTRCKSCAFKEDAEHGHINGVKPRYVAPDVLARMQELMQGVHRLVLMGGPADGQAVHTRPMDEVVVKCERWIVPTEHTSVSGAPLCRLVKGTRPSSWIARVDAVYEYHEGAYRFARNKTAWRCHSITKKGTRCLHTSPSPDAPCKQHRNMMARA